MNMVFTPAEKRAITRAKNILAEKLSTYDVAFNSPQSVNEFLMLRLADEEREHFEVLFLNSQNQLIVCERLFSGTINAASVYPREVIKRALELNAAAMILAHNHPSGDPEPSRADMNITKKIQDAAGLVDINVLDHLIIGGTDHVSFATRGLI